MAICLGSLLQEKIVTELGASFRHYEAIRKPFRTIAARSCSLLAIMKRWTTAERGSVQHKMYMTDLEHSRTRFWAAFIVFPVPAYRPCQAWVCSITQRFSSGVKPRVPAGRA